MQIVERPVSEFEFSFLVVVIFVFVAQLSFDTWECRFLSLEAVGVLHFAHKYMNIYSINIGPDIFIVIINLGDRAGTRSIRI